MFSSGSVQETSAGSSEPLGFSRSIQGCACLLLECPELPWEMLSQGLTWADPTYFIYFTFTHITDMALCMGGTLSPDSCMWTRLSKKSRFTNTSYYYIASSLSSS